MIHQLPRGSQPLDPFPVYRLVPIVDDEPVVVAPSPAQPGFAIPAAPETETEISCPLPDAAWSVGRCPACGGHLVDNEYYRGGGRYITRRQCWGAIAEGGDCHVEDFAAAFGDGSAKTEDC